MLGNLFLADEMWCNPIIQELAVQFHAGEKSGTTIG